jgi:hypothetical protein
MYCSVITIGQEMAVEIVHPILLSAAFVYYRDSKAKSRVQKRRLHLFCGS